jgi:hypothetical protein
MKEYYVKFKMEVEDECEVTPEAMLEVDNEDGKQLGYSIKHVEVTEL